MRFFICSILALLLCGRVQAQESPWRASIGAGHYPAQLLIPTFSPLNPSVRLGLVRQWNKDPRNQLVQSFNLNYFYHMHLQHAVQLYSELGYQWKAEGGLLLKPLMLGGGYVLSVSDMVSFEQQADGSYQQLAFPARNNWVISIGLGVGYEVSPAFLTRPITLEIDYRVQVQGVLIERSVPIIAYAPVMLGLSWPLK